MSESSWESSRRRSAKTRGIVLLLLVTFSLIVSVLFINNRDLIGGSSFQEPERTGSAVPDSGEQVSSGAAGSLSADSSGSDGIENAGKAGEDPEPGTDSMEKRPLLAGRTGTGIGPGILESAAGTPAMEPPPSDVHPKQGESERTSYTPEPGVRFAEIRERTINGRDQSVITTHSEMHSESLPPFSCRLESRKDIVIGLSLELFFNDAAKRSEIRLRREEIKIMVMRELRDMRLSGVRIGELEKRLLPGINSLFDVNVINALKIKNITVEKAGQ